MPPIAGDWTDEENDAIVADYVAMLADDVAGGPTTRRSPIGLLRGTIDRRRGSIEYHYCLLEPGDGPGALRVLDAQNQSVDLKMTDVGLPTMP